MSDDLDPLESIGTPSCPECLTLLEVSGNADDGVDARWQCPTCGLAVITPG